MQDGQIGIVTEYLLDHTDTIELFRITIVIQREDKFSHRLAHHSIARGYRPKTDFIDYQSRPRHVAFNEIDGIISATVRSDQDLGRRRIQSPQDIAGTFQVLQSIPGCDHYRQRHNSRRFGLPTFRIKKPIAEHFLPPGKSETFAHKQAREPAS
jgi:hypothetical protein